MKYQFTQDQQAVIHHRNGNLLVSAAAGSGKTAVLVERIVQMVTDAQNPVPVERILVLTFTNAAARQMKEKIESRICQALEEHPENLFLEEQYQALSMASIMTNHAFCLQILQDYITRIPGLDPGFRVADETEIELLKVDVLAQVLELFYTKALAQEDTPENLEFLAFMDAYGGSRQDSQVEDLLLQVYRFMASDPNPIGWLHHAVQQMNPNNWQKENPWHQMGAQQVKREIDSGLELLQELVQLLQNTAVGADSKTADKVEKLVKSLWQTVSDLCGNHLANQTADEMAKICQKLSWPKMSYTIWKDDPVVQLHAKELVTQMKKAFERAGDLYDAFWSDAALERHSQLVFPAMRGMERLLTAFDEAYSKAKREKNLVEFSDFEHGALQILQDPAVAADLRERYLYIYIDEYQDSNPLQEAIIERIARIDEAGQAYNVFMVGDVKQSIYRFRQADPSLFLDKLESYGQHPHTQKLLLKQNFRSEPSVLNAVNFVFEALMHKESGELEYDQDQKLYPGREQERTDQPEMYILTAPAGMDSEQQSEKEAEEAAQRILQLKEDGWQYRDMVILMRSVSSLGDIYRKTLEKKGIPVYAESSESFYDTQEIQTIMNLLHILDNPRQDIPLMGVLYSPIVGFSEADLGRIRLAGFELDFYEALIAFAKQDCEDEVHQKAATFLDNLQKWRKLAEVCTVHDLLWRLYEETGYYLYASAMPGGRLRRANLDLLLEKSIVFEKGIYSGLYQFLRYVEKLDKNRKTQEEAKILGEDENLVRIMTIHKSKGLEFPVVILAGLGRKWNTKDLDRRILLHRKLGIGADAIDSQHYLKYPSMTKSVLRHQLLREMAAEEMRLLYVAMTRAKSQLILYGTRKDEESAEQAYAEEAKIEEWRMPARQVLEARSYLQWLEPILTKKANAPFRIKRLVIGEESDKVATTVILEQEVAEKIDGQDLEQLNSIWKWQYKDAWMSQVPVRFSVSQMKQRQMEIEVNDTVEEAQLTAIEEKPSIRLNEAGGADVGTAFHTAMAQLQLASLESQELLEMELEELTAQGKLTQEEKQLVNRRWLLKFGASPLYQRIRNAKLVYLEQPFMMNVTLQELSEVFGQKEYGNSLETVMIQGMMDCFFLEDQRWVLVDYKTDWELDAQKLQGYQLQLNLYGTALERATGIPVKEKILYDVRRGKEILC